MKQLIFKMKLYSETLNTLINEPDQCLSEKLLRKELFVL